MSLDTGYFKDDDFWYKTFKRDKGMKQDICHTENIEMWVLVVKGTKTLVTDNANKPMIFPTRASARAEAYDDETPKKAFVSVEVDWFSKA